jgi:mono/diheme cytochrome c family protein
VIIATASRVGAQTTSVARGKYIVNDVAMCPTCHSPASVGSEESRVLAGGPVPFRPTVPTDDWAETAPRLAGSPPGTNEEIVRLLMTGISRTGRRPRPPMPQFRMTRADAQSVVAYLRSLQPAN